MKRFLSRSRALHRELALRTKEHLVRTKNIKLSSEESLELVRLILGIVENKSVVALHSPEKELSPEFEIESDALLAVLATRLSHFYSTANGGANGHPTYTREDWFRLARTDNSISTYWTWVAQQIEQTGAMWPWERESDRNVLITRAAFFSVLYDEERGWYLAGMDAPALPPTPTESEAWEAAAKTILAGPEIAKVFTAEELASLSIEALTAHITYVYSPEEALAEDEPMGVALNMHVYEPVATTEAQVEMSTKALCLAVGLEPKVAPHLNTPQCFNKDCACWTIDGSKCYESEHEAWLAGADAIRKEVMEKAGISYLEWAQYPLQEKIMLAKEYGPRFKGGSEAVAH